jgi:hypothetical protein
MLLLLLLFTGVQTSLVGVLSTKQLPATPLQSLPAPPALQTAHPPVTAARHALRALPMITHTARS